jgi:hypothetical protein
MGIKQCLGHKKCPQQRYLASHRRLHKMEIDANVCFCFELAKEKAETF